MLTVHFIFVGLWESSGRIQRFWIWGPVHCRTCLFFPGAFEVYLWKQLARVITWSLFRRLELATATLHTKCTKWRKHDGAHFGLRNFYSWEISVVYFIFLWIYVKFPCVSSWLVIMCIADRVYVCRYDCMYVCLYECIYSMHLCVFVGLCVGTRTFV